jgi:lactate 2-monooxygenase
MMTDDDNAAVESYSDYIFDIYREGILEGKLPPTTSNPALLEAQAKERMDTKGFWYIAGGAGEEATVKANREAFARWRILPRMMRPAKPRDLRVELFGETYSESAPVRLTERFTERRGEKRRWLTTRAAHPIVMAPIGVQSAYHPSAEGATAAACADLAVPYSISTASATSIEDIRSAAGESAPLWFQLYWPVSDAITISLLRRARKAGCKVLLVTLDTFTIAHRPRDLDTAFLPFVAGQGNAVGFTDPAWRALFAEDAGGATPEDQPLLASRHWMGQSASGVARRWGDVALLRRHWDGPIVLKGVLHPDDARLAVEHGADGIVVSNHGGRQVDGAVASLDMLPEIVAAVGDRATVLFDSGIRTGADVVKALCLGAKAVLVGRPVMYGLGIAGQRGARHVLATLLADFDQTLSLAGIRSVKELDRAVLRSAELKSAL